MKTIILVSISFWPMLVYFLVSIIIVLVMLGLSYYLGQRTKDTDTGDPYESGIKVTGSARLRFPANFYLIAMFFVLFDIESVFIITWAVSFRELGWAGYIAILIFVLILFAILFYEWRSGALTFEQSGKQVLKALKRIKKQQEINTTGNL
jgi:NADH-quinone oxidoreductase subunit A